MADSTSITNEIIKLFQTKGNESYYGERVSQLEHALQAAHFAQEEKASQALVAAALLHDIGHLLHDGPEDIADKGIDAKHEEIGHGWLVKNFGPEVSEPVRLHVAAKRYLCATDGKYLEQLSPASKQSLHLQGGPMTEVELDGFEEERFYADAVALRRWDDRAKVEKMSVPGIESYLPTLSSLVKS